MDDRPRLPYDVLLIIASYASNPTILALMRTSRDLHDDCVKYILADTVKLVDDHSIGSFIYFMRLGKHKRWRYVRSLTFVGQGWPSPSIAGELELDPPRLRQLPLPDRHAGYRAIAPHGAALKRTMVHRRPRHPPALA